MTHEAPTTWLSELRDQGRIVFRIGRRGDDLVAEFCSLGTLLASSRGHQARFEPNSRADAQAVEKLRASVIQGLIRHAQGKLTLHGGAVGLRSCAVALVGPSRSGKSLLVTALCADSDMQLVADDTVAVELAGPEQGYAVEALPSQGTTWLLPEARSVLGFSGAGAGKKPIELTVSESSRLSLRAVVSLVFGDDPKPHLRRLRGQQAFSMLSSSLIRFIVDDPVAQQREFDQLRALARTCGVFELSRPWDLTKLGGSVRLIRDLLASFDVSEAV